MSKDRIKPRLMKIVIPKGQTRWVTYRDDTGKPKYTITSDKNRDIYTLWTVNPKDGGLNKVMSGSSPMKFASVLEKAGFKI